MEKNAQNIALTRQ